MAEEIDILICGSGSAGLCAATLLARCGVRCKILESRLGPLTVGQADGVQCRTVEIFESLGIAEELLREAYHVLETVFWSSDGKGIVRRSRTADTMPGLSHQPHLILNQARMNALLLNSMWRFNGQEVDYGYKVKSVEVNSNVAKDPAAYPVTVVAEKDEKVEIFKAKYALGCDGAHSAVRKSLTYQMIGDSTDSLWGVMDVYPQTSFPDIRKKAAIHSNVGTLMIIPREGGSLVRLYIELRAGMVAKDVKLEDLHTTTRRIFHPYDFKIAETFWWSAYSVGQRLADHYSKDNRVFLAGDACHTHSPKAGQGMNVSLQDGYNIGWKLAEVLKGQAGPDLLKTYELERGKVAADLIDFDRRFAKLFSSKGAGDTANVSKEFSEQFIKAGRYTAGLTATYEDSPITRAAWSDQSLASNLKVGMRFPSTQVVRFCDAKAMHLVKALPADGRWRVIIFAGDIRDERAAKRLNQLGDYLLSTEGPVRAFTPKEADIDSLIEIIVVLCGSRVEIEQEDIPECFWPVTGKWRMRDLHKVFVDDESYNSGHGHAYEFYGVDQRHGALAVIRPDQYVAMVASLQKYDLIRDFFADFMRPII